MQQSRGGLCHLKILTVLWTSKSVHPGMESRCGAKQSYIMTAKKDRLQNLPLNFPVSGLWKQTGEILLLLWSLRTPNRKSR